jgi:hypothetical protein
MTAVVKADNPLLLSSGLTLIGMCRCSWFLSFATSSTTVMYHSMSCGIADAFVWEMFNPLLLSSGLTLIGMCHCSRFLSFATSSTTAMYHSMSHGIADAFVWEMFL